MIICIGDSITNGSPGVSYVNYIDKNQKIRNLGLGGDTLKGLILRLNKHRDEILSNSIIIQIGTNDILLPFLYEYSHKWKKRVIKIHKRGSIPCEDISEFKDFYESMILDLINIQKKTTLINILYW